MAIYKKFRKMENKDHSEVTRFLKKTTHLTAREWALARLCSDFKNGQGHSEMTWIGQNLPDLVPFFNEPYSRQEVSNARASFIKKIERSGTTLFYAFYSGLITKEEMLEIIHKITKNISGLLENENEAENEIDVNKGVQHHMVDVLRRINQALEE